MCFFFFFFFVSVLGRFYFVWSITLNKHPIMEDSQLGLWFYELFLCVPSVISFLFSFHYLRVSVDWTEVLQYYYTVTVSSNFSFHLVTCSTQESMIGTISAFSSLIWNNLLHSVKLLQ